MTGLWILATTRKCEEAGLHSPLWDGALQRINPKRDEISHYKRKDTLLIHVDERPTDTDYDRYVYLVDFFRKRNYDEERVRKDGCPFLIHDVLYKSEMDIFI